jgi:hypothetical protein
MCHECYKIALFCGLSPPLDKSRTVVTVRDSHSKKAKQTHISTHGPARRLRRESGRNSGDMHAIPAACSVKMKLQIMALGAYVCNEVCAGGPRGEGGEHTNLDAERAKVCKAAEHIQRDGEACEAPHREG